MIEKTIFYLEKKKYSWDLRFIDTDTLLLSYFDIDVTILDNFIDAFHIYVVFKEQRFRYFFAKGKEAKKSYSKKEILSIVRNLPTNEVKEI